MGTGHIPLVLLHGVTNSALIWTDVAAILGDEFDVLTPTAAGHRGGAAPSGPVTISSLVDEVEMLLDDLSLRCAHIAGNSMGGWMAIELARRGRALSVCAFSPAGFWTPGAEDETHATSAIRRNRRLARAAAPLAPLALRSNNLRRRLLRDAAEHGDRISLEQALEITRDLIGCTAAPDLLGTREQIASLDPAPCPITLAWSAADRIFPPSVNGTRAQQLIPQARYVELPGVGHVPMIDDPLLCAETIRSSIPR